MTFDELENDVFEESKYKITGIEPSVLRDPHRKDFDRNLRKLKKRTENRERYMKKGGIVDHNRDFYSELQKNKADINRYTNYYNRIKSSSNPKDKLVAKTINKRIDDLSDKRDELLNSRLATSNDKRIKFTSKLMRENNPEYVNKYEKFKNPKLKRDIKESVAELIDYDYYNTLTESEKYDYVSSLYESVKHDLLLDSICEKYVDGLINEQEMSMLIESVESMF